MGALQGRATAFVATPQVEECTGYVHVPYTTVQDSGLAFKIWEQIYGDACGVSLCAAILYYLGMQGSWKPVGRVSIRTNAKNLAV